MQDKRKTNGQTHLVLLAEKSLERRYGSELRVGRRVVELRLLPGLPLEDGREPGAVLLVKGLHEYHRLALEAQLQARALGGSIQWKRFWLKFSLEKSLEFWA